MTPIELAVLDTHTSDYPGELTFDQVLELIRTESIDVDIWHLFEDWDREALADHLESIVSAYNSQFPLGGDK